MKRSAFLLGVILLGACATAPQPQLADLLLTGGRVYTGDPAAPWAEAVAIRGDRISAVGPSAELDRMTGPTTRRVDLAGLLVIPGINDAHVHVPWPQEAVHSVSAPRDGVTRESLLAGLKRAVGEVQGDLTVVGDLPLALVDAGITRDDLDAISKSRRIRLAVFGGHSAILNTPALRAWAIEEDAADPAGGWYGRRDGRLDGWLYEHAYWTPQARYGETANDADLLRQIESFEDQMLGFGVTSVQTMPTIPPERLEALLANRPRRLRWRVMDFRLAPYNATPKKFPVKYILDGTPIERSAAMSAPYADDAAARGRLNYSAEEIEAMVRDAARGERQLLVHAVGDRTIATLLDAMERTSADWPSLRVRIEHGDGATPELAERARKLGVFIVQNPAHFTIADTMRARWGSERTTQPARSLVESGNRFALGSDGPLNPFLNMFFAAIHPANPAEALTVEQSLRAYTVGAAEAEFAENRKGKLAPGMLADLAVLSQDILSVPPPELRATRSVMTIVGGKVVWEGAAPAARPLEHDH